MTTRRAGDRAFVRRPLFVVTTCIATVFVLYMFVDIPVARFMDAHRGSAVYRFASHIDNLGRAEWYLVPAGAVLLFQWASKRTGKWKTIYFVCATTIASLLATLLKFVLGRCRPGAFIENNLYGFRFFGTTDEFRSFPSGHSTTAFAAAIAFGILFPRYRAFYWSFAVAVSIARIVTVRHYPADVAAAAWLGGSVAALLARLMLPPKAAKASPTS